MAVLKISGAVLTQLAMDVDALKFGSKTTDHDMPIVRLLVPILFHHYIFVFSQSSLSMESEIFEVHLLCALLDASQQHKLYGRRRRMGRTTRIGRMGRPLRHSVGDFWYESTDSVIQIWFPFAWMVERWMDVWRVVSCTGETFSLAVVGTIGFQRWFEFKAFFLRGDDIDVFWSSALSNGSSGLHVAINRTTSFDKSVIHLLYTSICVTFSASWQRWTRLWVFPSRRLCGCFSAFRIKIWEWFTRLCSGRRW